MKAASLVMAVTVLLIPLAYAEMGHGTPDNGHGGHAHVEANSVASENPGGGMQLYSLIKPLGIVTYGSVLVTLLLGLFRRKLRGRFLVLHRFAAYLTMALATAHGGLILLLH